jgi:uncharacterized protein (DUF305 family)
MRFRAARLILAAALGAALAASLPAAAEDANMDHTKMGGMKMDSGASPADAGYSRAMEDMDQTMRQPMTGDADVDFVVMMLPHHQGAVDMAKAALQYAKDPFVRQLSQDIIKSQEIEIAAMKQWLAAHAKDAPKTQP